MDSSTKAPWLSKTLWTNLLVAGVAFFPAAQAYIAANPMAVVMGFAGINIVLRLVTKSGLSIQ